MELILHCNRFVQKCEVCYCFNADIIANLNVLPTLYQAGVECWYIYMRKGKVCGGMFTGESYVRL